MVQRTLKNENMEFDSNQSYKDVIQTTLDSSGSLRVSENIYPVTSAIRINDASSGHQLVVMVDRPQGATSLKNGEIEVFQNRRVQTDDGKGLN